MTIRLSATLFGVLVAAIAIAAGPLFNVEGYSVVRHSTSELGPRAPLAPG